MSLEDTLITFTLKEMTKDKPKKCGLFENGRLIDTFPSKGKAKNAKYWKEKEANRDWLDLSYEVKEL